MAEEKNHKTVCLVRKANAPVCTLFPSVSMVIPFACEWEFLFMTALSDTRNWYFPDFRCRKWGKWGYKKLFLPKSFTKETPYNYGNFQDKGTLLEVYSEMGGFPRLNTRPILDISKGSFSKIALPQRPYIAIQTAAANPLRSWDSDKWERLIQQFPSVTFVEIGTKPLIKNAINCDSNLCGKLSVADIAYVVNNSIGFIGTDSSCAHYASALCKRSLIIMSKYYDWKQYNPFSGIEDDSSFRLAYFPCEMKDVPVEKVVEYVKQHFNF
ncbi:MAG: hypothetical protein K6A36_07310 [Paludibacteraceae bacterium]|nr:hypothetical protein [Paludibacteraceae bacterium]